jgi:hypothetical protein
VRTTAQPASSVMNSVVLSAGSAAYTDARRASRAVLPDDALELPGRVRDVRHAIETGHDGTRQSGVTSVEATCAARPMSGDVGARPT